METRFFPLSLVFLAAVFVRPTESITPLPLRDGVGSCAPILLEDFGSATGFSDVGILPVSFIGMDNNSAPPFLRVRRFILLCEAIGVSRSSVSSISALVEYDRQSPLATGLTAQVTVDCVAGENPSFYPTSPSGSNGQTLDTTQSANNKLNTDVIGDFSAPTKRDCGLCWEGASSNLDVDDASNCLGRLSYRVILSEHNYFK